MQPKEYLQQIEKIDKSIKFKQKEIKELEDLATSITSKPSADKVQSSSNQDKLGNVVANIVDLQKEINNDINELVALKKEITKVVDLLDVEYITLIYKRYYEYKTWEQIATEMCYSYRHITRLHGFALKEVEKIIKNKCP